VHPLPTSEKKRKKKKTWLGKEVGLEDASADVLNNNIYLNSTYTRDEDSPIGVEYFPWSQ